MRVVTLGTHPCPRGFVIAVLSLGMIVPTPVVGARRARAQEVFPWLLPPGLEDFGKTVGTFPGPGSTPPVPDGPIRSRFLMSVYGSPLQPSWPAAPAAPQPDAPTPAPAPAPAPAPVDAFRARAEERLENGDIDGAIEDLNRAILLEPRNPQLFLVRGDYYQRRAVASGARPWHEELGLVRGDDSRRKNDRAHAITDFERAIRLRPQDGEAYACLGRAHLEDDLFESAIDDLSAAIRLSPDDFYSHFTRGWAYRQAGDDLRAIADFDRAIALKPEVSETYLNRGRCRLRRQEYAQAVADFDRAIQLVPNDFLGWFLRGLCHEKRQAHDRAIADFDQALRLEPRRGEVYLARIGALIEAGDLERALADCERIGLGPNGQPMAPMIRFQIHLRQRKLDRALADLERSVEREPHLATGAILMLPALDPARRHLDRTLERLERLAKRSAEPEAVPFLRGCVLTFYGQARRAIVEFNHAVEAEPDALPVYLFRGWAFLETDQVAPALADFDRVVALDPDFGPAYASRGLTFARRGEHARAIEEYSRAIELMRVERRRTGSGFGWSIEFGPDQDAESKYLVGREWPSIHALRGEAFLALGDVDRALADAERALREDPNDAYGFQLKGLCFKARNDSTRAVTALRQSLALTDDPEQRAETEQALLELGTP